MCNLLLPNHFFKVFQSVVHGKRVKEMLYTVKSFMTLLWREKLTDGLWRFLNL